AGAAWRTFVHTDADCVDCRDAQGSSRTAVASSRCNRTGEDQPQGETMNSRGIVTIATATAVLAAVGAAVYAQDKFDKYSLVSPGGIKFSDFRGYEDWAVISSARTDKELKVIVGNPAIIKAFKAGTPGNGQAFPEGSKMVKMQWKLKKSTEAPFEVEVPDTPTQAFVMEKDSKRF